jgi:putative membrane protein
MNYSTASTIKFPEKNNPSLPKIFLALFICIWIWTLVDTSDIKNWFMENTLTFIFGAILILSYKKYRLSDLSYTFICIYLLLHIYGAKYTYAENPFGYWLMEVFHTSRNHYDRIVHFSFGFMLAYPMRDLFKNTFEFPDKYCWLLPAEITLSFSAMYELIEWLVADVFFPAQGVAYLGSQGDVWDAQKDMVLAFSGAILILTFTFLIKKVVQPAYPDSLAKQAHTV